MSIELTTATNAERQNILNALVSGSVTIAKEKISGVVDGYVFNPALARGNITTLAQGLLDPVANPGVFYVSTVAGTLSGTNSGNIPVLAGQYVVSTGAAYVAMTSAGLVAENALLEITALGVGKTRDARLNLDVIPRHMLQAFQAKLARIQASGTGVASVMYIGDSVGADITLPLLVPYHRSYGMGGLMNGGEQQGITNTTSGITSVAGDFTRSISGEHQTATAAAWIAKRYNSAFEFNGVPVKNGGIPSAFKIIYVIEAGAGDFKIQSSANGVTWLDIAGYESISAVGGSTTWGFVTAPNTNNHLQFRVLTNSGTVRFISTGVVSTKGVRLDFSVSGTGGSVMANLASAPEVIWKAYLEDMRPDVVHVLFKDAVDQPMRDALVTFNTYLQRYAPQCAVVWVGAYNSEQDDPGVTPAPAVATLMATERQAILDFLATNPAGEQYYWPANRYIGTWRRAAAQGLFDAEGTQVALSSLSASGTTVTIVATSHGLATGNFARISDVQQTEFNGSWQVSVTNATTFTFNLPASAIASSGTGGNMARLDTVHLNTQGKAVLAEAFLRDFGLLSGLNAGYPFGVTSVPVSGVIVSSNTTEVSGTAAATNGAAAIVTSGGIYAGRSIRTDSGIRAGGLLPSSTDVMLSQASSPTKITGVNALITHAPTVNSAATSEAVNGELTLSAAGAVNTAPGGTGSLSGTRGNVRTSGSGTGVISIVTGALGQIEANSSHTITNAEGLRSRVAVEGATNVTNASGLIFLATKAGAGVIANYLAINITNQINSIATNVWAFFNGSNAQSFMGTAGMRMATTTGPIWNSGANTPEGAVTAPVGSLWTRTNGGAGTTLYIKESGTGNTGWVAK